MAKKAAPKAAVKKSAPTLVRVEGRVPSTLKTRLNKFSKKHHKTYGEVITQALEAYLV